MKPLSLTERVVKNQNNIKVYNGQVLCYGLKILLAIVPKLKIINMYRIEI